MRIVIFRIGLNYYGLDIMRVDEVINYTSPQKVPKMPTFIEGVIDFRKRIVPLFDMRKRFEVDDISYTLFTRIILLRSSDHLIGLIVDDASDVLKYEADQFRTKPENIVALNNKFIHGFVKQADRTIILLDIDKILSTKETSILNKFDKTLKKKQDR